MSVADPRVIARATLAAWFHAKLPTLNVSEKWPTVGKPIAMPALTVLAAPNIRPQYHQPRIWKTTPTTGNQATTLYSYGCADMDLQLDVWAAFEAARDKTAADVEAWFNVNPKVSLGTAGSITDLTNAPGLVLAMSGYYNTLCEYVIDPVAGRLPEASDQAQAGEWRQTYSVRAMMYLCSQEQVTLLQSAVMQLKLNGASVADSIPVAP